MGRILPSVFRAPSIGAFADLHKGSENTQTAIWGGGADTTRFHWAKPNGSLRNPPVDSWFVVAVLPGLLEVEFLPWKNWNR